MQKRLSSENLSLEGGLGVRADLKLSEMLLNLKEEDSERQYEEIIQYEIEIQYQEKKKFNKKLEKEPKLGKTYIMHSSELKRDCIQQVFFKN